jgi:hypothetical protein
MKMIRKSYFLMILLFASLLIISCEKNEEDPINESEVLAAYLESTDSPLQKDFVNTDMPTIMPATEVQT